MDIKSKLQQTEPYWTALIESELHSLAFSYRKDNDLSIKEFKEDLKRLRLPKRRIKLIHKILTCSEYGKEIEKLRVTEFFKVIIFLGKSPDEFLNRIIKVKERF